MHEKQLETDEHAILKDLNMIMEIKFKNLLQDVLLPSKPDEMQRILTTLEGRIKRNKDELNDKKSALRVLNNDVSQLDLLINQDKRKLLEAQGKLEEEEKKEGAINMGDCVNQLNVFNLKIENKMHTTSKNVNMSKKK